MSSSSFNIWKLRYNLGVQGPDMTGTRYHTVIFVETNSPKAGEGRITTSPATS